MTKPRRVLIVDDEPTVRTLLACAVEHDAVAASVATADAALNLLRTATFDLIVVDKNLPGMDGIELIRSIRRDDRHTPIVMITGYASKASALETLHLGISAFFEKPFDDVFEVGRRLVKIMVAHERTRVPPKTAPPARGRVGNAGRRHIVVACPNADERRWIEEALEPLGAVITALSSSIRALPLATRQPFDLVVADEQDGNLHDVLPILRNGTPRIDAVLVHDALLLEEIVRLINLGVSAMVERPLVVELFRERVGKVLQSRRR